MEISNVICNHAIQIIKIIEKSYKIIWKITTKFYIESNLIQDYKKLETASILISFL